MKHHLSVAALMFALLGAAPATGPTSQPDKPITFASLVRSIPKGIRPPSGQKLTSVEAKAIGKWVATAANGGTLSIKTTDFTYEDTKPGVAFFNVAPTEIEGARWAVTGNATISEASKAKVNRSRDQRSWTLTGTVESAKVNSTEGGEYPYFSFTIDLVETDAR